MWRSSHAGLKKKRMNLLFVANRDMSKSYLTGQDLPMELPGLNHFKVFAMEAEMASAMAFMPLSPGWRATPSCSILRSERA